MKTRAFALATAIIAVSAGAAMARDTRFYDVSPEHFMHHNSTQAYSGSNGQDRAVVGRPIWGAGQAPTYMLPRELQWMNRPIDPASGANR